MTRSAAVTAREDGRQSIGVGQRHPQRQFPLSTYNPSRLVTTGAPARYREIQPSGLTSKATLTRTPELSKGRMRW